MKKIVTSLLLSAMLLQLISCSTATTGNEENTNTTTENNAVTAVDTVVEEETKKYLDDLPDDLDFGGYEVRFVSSDEKDSIYISAEDVTGELVSDAYWKRNQALTERLNISIAEPVVTGSGSLSSTASASVIAGSNDYDVICGHTRFNVALAADGKLLNLNEAPYIDRTKTYWSNLYMDNINYMDNIYWLTGDMTTTFIADIYAMFVNSKLWTNLYQDENIYDVVLEGNWTIDTLNQYASGSYSDINGNGNRDDGDAYGVIMQKGHVLNGMFFAANVVYTGVDGDGNYSVALNNEHTIDVFDKLHTLFYSTEYARMLDNAPFDTLSVEMFSTGRLLFCPHTFGFAGNGTIREMEDDFYIIPLPKFDADQENYRVNQYDGVPIYGLPITMDEEQKNMICAVLEAMCSMTSQTVIPVYYDSALKNKYSRDETTAVMIDLIHDSITADFCFAWGDSCGNTMSIFYENIQNDSIESTMKKSEKLWAKALEKLIGKLTAVQN